MGLSGEVVSCAWGIDSEKEEEGIKFGVSWIGAS